MVVERYINDTISIDQSMIFELGLLAKCFPNAAQRSSKVIWILHRKLAKLHDDTFQALVKRAGAVAARSSFAQGSFFLSPCNTHQWRKCFHQAFGQKGLQMPVITE